MNTTISHIRQRELASFHMTRLSAAPELWGTRYDLVEEARRAAVRNDPRWCEELEQAVCVAAASGGWCRGVAQWAAALARSLAGLRGRIALRITGRYPARV
jgi:hypothetical protein